MSEILSNSITERCWRCPGIRLAFEGRSWEESKHSISMFGECGILNNDTY